MTLCAVLQTECPPNKSFLRACESLPLTSVSHLADLQQTLGLDPAREDEAGNTSLHLAVKQREPSDAKVDYLMLDMGMGDLKEAKNKVCVILVPSRNLN